MALHVLWSFTSVHNSHKASILQSDRIKYNKLQRKIRHNISLIKMLFKSPPTFYEDKAFILSTSNRTGKIYYLGLNCANLTSAKIPENLVLLGSNSYSCNIKELLFRGLTSNSSKQRR